MDHRDTTGIDNARIEEAIRLFCQEETEDRLTGVYTAIKERIVQNGHLLFPVDVAMILD